MKNHLLLNRSISLFLIFVLLIQQYGCISTKNIQPANLSISEENQYKLRYQIAVYDIKEAQVTNDTLRGKIDLTYKSIQKNNVVYIEPFADSLVKIDTDYYFTLPLSGITKVYKEDKAPGKTALVVGGSIAGFIVLLSFLVASSLSYSGGL
jgi:hypothetical protein